MKIGIIGTGAIGSILAKRMAALGYEVRVANSRGKEAVQAFATSIGAIAADADGAVLDADVVILSIPYASISRIPKTVFEKIPEDAVVIDTGNYYPAVRDPVVQAIDAGKPESVWVSEQIGRTVTKAFNILFSETLDHAARAEGAPDRLAIAVAGDNAEHKKIAMRLVNETGFDPVDAGSLEDSWRQQPGAPSYSCDLNAVELRTALARAIPGVPAKNRDYFLAHLGALLGGSPTRERMVSIQRMVNNPSWPIAAGN